MLPFAILPFSLGQVRQSGTGNEIDCRNPNVLYAGELTNWRVQKLTLHQ
jgi:hypothetical protein